MYYFITPHFCCHVIRSPRLKIVLPRAFALQELNFVLLDSCVNQEVGYVDVLTLEDQITTLA
jgi:hypothetical protein